MVGGAPDPPLDAAGGTAGVVGEEEKATHCKLNRAAFYHHLSPALPSAQGGVARSLSSRRASYKCMA